MWNNDTHISSLRDGQGTNPSFNCFSYVSFTAGGANKASDLDFTESQTSTGLQMLETVPCIRMFLLVMPFVAILSECKASLVPSSSDAALTRVRLSSFECATPLFELTD